MPSPFEAEVQDATAAVDAAFAKSFTLQPRIAGPDVNGADIADTSRAPLTFNATFTQHEGKPIIARAYDPRADQRPGTQAVHPLIRIAPAELARGVVVKARDLLVDQGTGQTWRVSSVYLSSYGIAVCSVNLAG